MTSTNNKSPSIKITQINVEGAKHIGSYIIEPLILPLYSINNLNDSLNEIQSICGKLEALNLVKQVDVILDKNEDKEKGGVKVILKLKELPSLTIQSGTEIGNGDGNMSASVTRNNWLGLAERFEGSIAYGTKTTSSIQFSLSKPLSINSPHTRMELYGLKNLIDNQLYRNHDVLNRELGLQLLTVSKFGNHMLGYKFNWRTLDKVGNNASDFVRNQCGHHIKSSLFHTLINELWDEKEVPENGYKFQFNQELAGLKGDISYLKLDTNYQSKLGLGNGFGLGLGLQAGMVLPLLQNDNKFNGMMPLPDKFNLGSPTSVRGFGIEGLGKKQRGDSLGGDLVGALGLSCFTPLPYFTTPKFKGHLFFNAGNLANYQQGIPLLTQFKTLFSKPSSTFGMGLLYHHQHIRLELNYVLPLSAHQTDRISLGWQLGLGISFL